MRKIIFYVLMAFVALTAMVACGGSNEKRSVSIDGEEVVVSQEVADLDLQGISDLIKKNSADITSDDYDFVIEQLEILNKKTSNMDKEEFKIWKDSLSKDDQGVVMTLAIMAAGMQKRGELSDEQKARLEKVMADLDKH